MDLLAQLADCPDAAAILADMFWYTSTVASQEGMRCATRSPTMSTSAGSGTARAAAASAASASA